MRRPPNAQFSVLLEGLFRPILVELEGDKDEPRNSAPKVVPGWGNWVNSLFMWPGRLQCSGDVRASQNDRCQLFAIASYSTRFKVKIPQASVSPARQNYLFSHVTASSTASRQQMRLILCI